MEPELKELMAAVGHHEARICVAFGKLARFTHQGSHCPAIEREAASFAVRLLEDATAPLFIRHRTREAQRKAIADHLLTELNRWRKVMEAK